MHSGKWCIPINARVWVVPQGLTRTVEVWHNDEADCAYKKMHQLSFVQRAHSVRYAGSLAAHTDECVCTTTQGHQKDEQSSIRVVTRPCVVVHEEAQDL